MLMNPGRLEVFAHAGELAAANGILNLGAVANVLAGVVIGEAFDETLSAKLPEIRPKAAYSEVFAGDVPNAGDRGVVRVRIPLDDVGISSRVLGRIRA